MKTAPTSAAETGAYRAIVLGAGGAAVEALHHDDLVKLLAS